MMILLIDAGNSRCKCGIYNSSGDCFEYYWNTNYNELRFPEDICTKYSIDKTYIAAVASCKKRRLVTSEIHRLNLPEAIELKVDSSLLNTKYDPSLLGIDRWLALMALKFEGRESAIIIDCGTAVTIDVLRQDVHIGGWIIPGLQSMKQSLLTSTNIKLKEKISNFSLQPATNTYDAINDGCTIAIIALIEKLIEPSNKEDPSLLVITGGYAPLIQGSMNHPVLYRKNLVLEGMKSVVKNTLHC